MSFSCVFQFDLNKSTIFVWNDSVPDDSGSWSETLKWKRAREAVKIPGLVSWLSSPPWLDQLLSSIFARS